MSNLEQKAKRHYHVLNGLAGGYLPDGNGFYKTKKEAQSGLKWVKDQLQDSEDQAVDYKLRSKDRVVYRGSLREGFYGSSDGRYYAEITECFNPECEENSEDFP